MEQQFSANYILTQNEQCTLSRMKQKRSKKNQNLIFTLGADDSSLKFLYIMKKVCSTYFSSAEKILPGW